ncbi:MAG TPA: matrixin family metalloprotease [Bryobacteraceae bacterium]|nr:matrixin family metalloprotease [Bryobacteraceae bacterium]
MTSRAIWPMFLAAVCGAQAADLRYYVEPCTHPETACHADDPQLAQWAMEAWQKASSGALKLERVNRREDAQIRILWSDGLSGQYGETVPIVVGGKRGAEVHVRPDMTQLGPDISAATRTDSLLRDAIVYLTCLHESGHALGLPHTGAFADIMYTFQLGGDIGEYFGRYRRKLSSRADISKNSGLSEADRSRLLDIVRSEAF